MIKTIWIVSGGAEAVPGIRKAREMGLRVVVSDGSPRAPGLRLAEHQAIVSTYDVEGTVAAARRFRQQQGRIDGVISMAADVPQTVAAVAEELGLPGPSPQTAAWAADKIEMKRRFADQGIPIPWFHEVTSAQELRELEQSRSGRMILKPVDSRGARGVMILWPATDREWAFRHAHSCSPSGRVMVEEYLEGRQFSTESVVLAEGASTPGFSERNYPHLERCAPFVIEDGGQQPPDLPEPDREAVCRTAEAAARALGIEGWTAKGDMVLTEAGPKVIEIAARLSGGWFSSHQIPISSGVDLLRVSLRLALGETPLPGEIAATQRIPVAIRYYFPPAGIVTCVPARDRLLEQAGILEAGFAVAEGDRLEHPADHTQRAGFVMAQGETTAQAVERAAALIEQFPVKTRPVEAGRRAGDGASR